MEAGTFAQIVERLGNLSSLIDDIGPAVKRTVKVFGEGWDDQTSEFGTKYWTNSS
jgi:hypothetical protein